MLLCCLLCVLLIPIPVQALLIAHNVASQLLSSSLLQQVPGLRGRVLTEDDLCLEPLSSSAGGLSQCFRCHVRGEGVLFLKQAEQATLRCEYEGMAAFAKHNPQLMPRLLGITADHTLMAAEYIAGYERADVLLAGHHAGELSVTVAQLMGQSHARTLSGRGRDEQTTTLFSNAEACAAWDRELFEPTLSRLRDLLPRGGAAERQEGVRERVCGEQTLRAHDERVVWAYDQSPEEVLQAMAGSGGGLLEAVLELRTLALTHCTTSSSTSSLLHGYALPRSLLYDPAALQQQGQLRLKVVGFGGCRRGPAGLDLGLFVSGLLQHLLAASRPAVRASLQKALFDALDAYRTSFADQLLLRDEEEEKEVLLTAEGVLRDALGYAGLALLFHLLATPWSSRSSSAEEVQEEYRVLDRQGRRRALGRRRVYLLLALLQAYAGGGGVDALRQALARDDHYLLTEHHTEFWY